MKRKWLLTLFLIGGLMLSGCSNSGSAPAQGQEKQSDQTVKKEILISAAASLKNALTEIEKVYEEKNSGVDLTISFASSGTLQKQIEQGAPADIFLSAGKSQMDALEEKNLLLKDSRTNFLANDLVLIVGENNKDINSFDDLKKAKQISIGTPESVPAGKYAKEALTKMNLWDTLNADSKFVLAKDVTAVLTYVESENVEAGIVYGSDAHESQKTKIVANAPEDSHSPIIYPGAIISTTKNPDECKAFMQYICSQEAQDIFVKYGFKATE